MEKAFADWPTQRKEVIWCWKDISFQECLSEMLFTLNTIKTRTVVSAAIELITKLKQSRKLISVDWKRKAHLSTGLRSTE